MSLIFILKAVQNYFCLLYQVSHHLIHVQVIRFEFFCFLRFLLMRFLVFVLTLILILLISILRFLLFLPVWFLVSFSLTPFSLNGLIILLFILWASRFLIIATYFYLLTHQLFFRHFEVVEFINIYLDNYLQMLLQSSCLGI